MNANFSWLRQIGMFLAVTLVVVSAGVLLGGCKRRKIHIRHHDDTRLVRVRHSSGGRDRIAKSPRYDRSRRDRDDSRARRSRSGRRRR